MNPLRTIWLAASCNRPLLVAALLTFSVSFASPLASKALHVNPTSEVTAKAAPAAVYAADTLRPSFPGGEVKMGDYIGEHYTYPFDDVIEFMSGFAIVQFEVQTDGKLIDFQVLKASQQVFSDELKQVLKQMPAWQPAQIKGQPVSATYIFPLMCRVHGRDEPEVERAFLKDMAKVRSRARRSKELLFVTDPVFLTLNISRPKLNLPEDMNDTLKTLLQKGIYTYIEQPPQFPGGEKALNSYISKHFELPADVRAKNVHGEVVVSFVVDDDGSLYFPEVRNKKGYGIDEAAIRLVKLMPKFEPGVQNKKKVAFRYHLSIPY